MEYVFERTINYYETDKMGIVHHSNYIRFLEEARCEFLKALDIPYQDFETNGLMIPVLGVNCSYKHHVTFGDTICIKCTITKFTGVQMVVSYNITNKTNGDLVMTAETKHCFTDNSLKPIRLKNVFSKAYENLANCVINK